MHSPDVTSLKRPLFAYPGYSLLREILELFESVDRQEEVVMVHMDTGFQLYFCTGPSAVLSPTWFTFFSAYVLGPVSELYS